MDYILEQGWAEVVSPEDLGHGHVCVYSGLINDRLRKYEVKKNVLLHFFESEQKLRELVEMELGNLDIMMLYHTHELDGKSNDPNRNIMSIPGSNPQIIHPSNANKYQIKNDPFRAIEMNRSTSAITVYSRDIGLTELFDVEFELNSQGENILKDSRKINIYAKAINLS
jgi:hypothetical protein